MNRRGEVVGTGVERATLDLVGWHWSGGKTTLLKAPAGTVAMPAAISDTGRIVGAVASDDDGAANPTSGEAPEQAASWASMNAPAKILPALAGDVGAHAYGVNKNGITVGNSQASDHFTAVVWDAGGHVTALPGLGGSFGIARAIDDTGVAVGDAVPASGDPEAVTWDVGHHPKSHGKAKGRNTQATGLVHGRAVGQTQVRGADGVDRPRAVLWDAAGTDTTLPPLSGDPGAGVNAAADSTGVAAGFSSDAHGVAPADDVDVRVDERRRPRRTSRGSSGSACRSSSWWRWPSSAWPRGCLRAGALRPPRLPPRRSRSAWPVTSARPTPPPGRSSTR